MNINIVKNAAISIILLGIIGMTANSANADENGDGSACPNYPWKGKLESDKVIVLEQTDGNVITYSLKSSVVPGTTTTIPGFKALCIMPDGEFEGDDGDISAIPVDWEDQIKDDFIAFSAKGGNNKNLPFDNNAHEVGEVDYTGHGGLPTNQEYLVHVISASICGGYEKNGEEKTCFIKPGEPEIPVPELNSVILISVGLLGLGLVSRKYKR